MTSTDFQYLNHGISCIDTGLGRPGLAACYLMEQDGEAAVIETGTAHTVPRILACIKARGFKTEDVRFVFITHVHLDHAGGAGALIDALPNARLVVHPRGARHMEDPAKLQASATAVYGEQKYQETYGDLSPIPVSRMLIAEDNSDYFLGGRRLKVIDTPGHARHHFCVYDELSRGIFTGDTLGVAYPELNPGGDSFVMPTTTPIQFDPPALKQSIDRLMTLRPERFFLTHYGMVQDTERHARLLKREIDHYVAIARQHNNAEDRVGLIFQALLDHTLESLRREGSPLSAVEQKRLIEGDLQLNAQGIDHWLASAEAAL